MDAQVSRAVRPTMCNTARQGLIHRYAAQGAARRTNPVAHTAPPATMAPVDAVAATALVTTRTGFTGPKAGLAELAMRNGFGEKQSASTWVFHGWLHSQQN